MTKFQAFLLALPLSLAEFTAKHPRLEAQVSLTADNYWHLGGFCFGHDKDDRVVGRLEGILEWEGGVPLQKASVYLAGFDGREDRWGQAARTWNSSSCEEKLQEASAYIQLRSLGSQPQALNIRIVQGTGTRDWHFVLVAVLRPSGIGHLEIEVGSHGRCFVDL